MIGERDTDMKNTYDLIIVGGGPANQCIHNGFGLHTFKEELTGPEYAQRYIDQAMELSIPYKLNTMVLDIARDGKEKVVTIMNREEGLVFLRTKAVILAMGCRERPRGALNIPGYRPAGIYTAGTAQRLVNMEGYMPGREVVILGSGDIGLIMARRMTLEGAKVKVVAELMPYSGGLQRNIVQCLEDFNIPLKLSHTVIDIQGKERVTGITIAQVDENRKPIPGTEEFYSCDTLLLSCGLIPENELSSKLGARLSPVTSGPVVNESLETSVEGVFACGNVLHVHDLVDYVSEKENVIRIQTEGGIRYSVPQMIRPDHMEDTVTLRFRVGRVFKDVYVSVYRGGERIVHKKRKKMAPGEMEQLVLKKSDLTAAEGLDKIVMKVEEE